MSKILRFTTYLGSNCEILSLVENRPQGCKKEESLVLKLNEKAADLPIEILAHSSASSAISLLSNSSAVLTSVDQ